MPSILDTEVGGDEANSYSDATFANSYLELKRNVTNWPAGATDQEKLLLEAMAPIEAGDYWGVVADAAQALQFPRVTQAGATGFYDSRGRLWASAAIPAPIKAAQVELALALADARYSTTGTAARVSEYETDRLRVKLATGSSDADLPSFVESLLAPFLVKAAPVQSVALTNQATW